MNEKSKKYSYIIGWQKSHLLVKEIYRITRQFSKEEIVGITLQIRRAVISVPVNLAEGFSRTVIKDKLRFYNIAEGSFY